jgi:hypothetical protein
MLPGCGIYLLSVILVIREQHTIITVQASYKDLSYNNIGSVKIE